MNHLEAACQKSKNIYTNRLSIYDVIDIGHPLFWFTQDELESILNYNLIGHSLSGLPIRSRSKVMKEHICEVLGYPIPRSFRKTNPRFIGQNFDVYVQKSNNLQIWNEDVDPQRRYILVRIDENDIITIFKVISGNELAKLDTTGTLTSKYQARLPSNIITPSIELISHDTKNIRHLILSNFSKDLSIYSPLDTPSIEQLLPIEECFNRLKNIVGTSFLDSGAIQERLRGDFLHNLACKALGYKFHADNGTFPDIKHQLLEIKLQTSPTIDLGVTCPDSDSDLDIEKVRGFKFRHCDVRYAVFYGKIDNGYVHINGLYITSGESFFTKFEKFGGKVVNQKIQIPLPSYFFN